ncbi:MAG: hypothetical protein OXH85_02660 [Truepera sp.]|nr:hypothetical protein [Truepera sp.]
MRSNAQSPGIAHQVGIIWYPVHGATEQTQVPLVCFHGSREQHTRALDINCNRLKQLIGNMLGQN